MTCESPLSILVSGLRPSGTRTLLADGEFCANDDLLLGGIVKPHFQHIAILVNRVTVLIGSGCFKAYFATADAAKIRM